MEIFLISKWAIILWIKYSIVVFKKLFYFGKVDWVLRTYIDFAQKFFEREKNKTSQLE